MINEIIERKPIFVIQLGNGHPEEADAIKISQHLKYLEDDYHVMLCFNDSVENKFELFSDRDIEPIDLEALKLKLGLCKK